MQRCLKKDTMRALVVSQEGAPNRPQYTIILKMGASPKGTPNIGQRNIPINPYITPDSVATFLSIKFSIIGGGGLIPQSSKQ